MNPSYAEASCQNNTLSMDLDQIANRLQLVNPSLRYQIDEKYFEEILCDNITSDAKVEISGTKNVLLDTECHFDQTAGLKAKKARNSISNGSEKYRSEKTDQKAAGIDGIDGNEGLEQWLDDILQ
uniref:AlNc14C153G7557 protein n=1 Tax=Albugo laibachii Nc14 TaxID=890382 RepID=F0WM54_9STRA|nr:AlNc14C153G7557 [Albugo laibachii Nc14]|eukprot:CCA22382.1 AlNc14C153G7557 [Albugo laibachii Nc14]